MEKTRMRPKNTRKTLKEVRRRCKANRIEVEVIAGRGKGSHLTIVFRASSPADVQVKLTIPGDEEISPGVQRGCLKRLTEIIQDALGSAPRVALAEMVRRILESLFK